MWLQVLSFTQTKLLQVFCGVIPNSLVSSLERNRLWNQRGVDENGKPRPLFIGWGKGRGARACHGWHGRATCLSLVLCLIPVLSSYKPLRYDWEHGRAIGGTVVLVQLSRQGVNRWHSCRFSKLLQFVFSWARAWHGWHDRASLFGGLLLTDLRLTCWPCVPWWCARPCHSLHGRAFLATCWFPWFLEFSTLFLLAFCSFSFLDLGNLQKSNRNDLGSI